MELTGKTEVAFNKFWYKFRSQSKQKNVYQLTLKQFNNLPESMRWGVYVDFFDLTGISIEICREKGYQVDIEVYDDQGTEFFVPSIRKIASRPLARTAAITKANELFNDGY